MRFLSFEHAWGLVDVLALEQKLLLFATLGGILTVAEVIDHLLHRDALALRQRVLTQQEKVRFFLFLEQVLLEDRI